MTTRPRVSFVVAMDQDGAIGKGGDLPWKLPADMKRFRDLTLGP
jgi:dihydrofolate reductase